MTVDELIKHLTELSEDGKGEYDVLVSDYYGCLNITEDFELTMSAVVLK